MQKVQKLEQDNKQTDSCQRTKEIQQLLHQIKLIDALDIAQSVMYAKQLSYDYKDKAGKQLARVLSEHLVKSKVS